MSIQKTTWLERRLPDGRYLVAMPLTYGRGRLGITPPDDRTGFTDVW